ncbi:hypothetical protein D6745_01460 [Candidatus Woesearchaeota archaeon]|nr:MAG: hypothetical protein D6745_01460 [Candidatus Woesearchaeota archaeon]
MSFSALIKYPEPGSYDCFYPEFQEKNNARATVALSKEKNKVVFMINSKDFTAFKARINSVIKLIEVYEKAKNGNEQRS